MTAVQPHSLENRLPLCLCFFLYPPTRRVVPLIQTANRSHPQDSLGPLFFGKRYFFHRSPPFSNQDCSFFSWRGAGFSENGGSQLTLPSSLPGGWPSSLRQYSSNVVCPAIRFVELGVAVLDGPFTHLRVTKAPPLLQIAPISLFFFLRGPRIPRRFRLRLFFHLFFFFRSLKYLPTSIPPFVRRMISPSRRS